MENDGRDIDISEEIEETSKNEGVPKQIAEKEEAIAKHIAEIPITEEDELEKRKRKIISFVKQKKDWIPYVVLSFIVFLTIYIRTRNIPRLKDITDGSWMLGPDLDPFLFLRWAEHIVENGKLIVIDTMRNVPLGFNTAGDMKLLSYMIAWLYHFLSFFSKEVTVTYAGIILPVIMAALTAIAFFLFARKIFYKENKSTRNITALIATALFIVIPSLLQRTIAGIPEKESAAFFFMFMAFYLFLEAMTSKKLKKSVIFGILAGVSTGLMALIWGGVIFVFFTISTTILLAFILGKVNKKEFIILALWLGTSFILMIPFSTRYALKNLIMSVSTGFAIGVLFLIGVSLVIMNNPKLNTLRKKTKLPKELFSLIISGLMLLLIISVILGPGFLIERANYVKSDLISPQTTRWGLTVAENKQPYFANDWKNSFGPVKFGIPLYFWLFFAGAVALFNGLVRTLNKKERWILTTSYFIFLIALIFSRYSPGSKLDGVSGLSLTVYFGGWLFFLGSFGYFYYKRHQIKSLEIFKDFNFAYILYFIIFTLGLIGARGGIRLIMVLGAISPIAVSFLIMKISKKYFKEKEDSMKFFIGFLAVIILLASLFTFWGYYKSDLATAENFAPGAYQWQWQKAMQWVRENLQKDAVFAHWWDYGYWVQSIGKRATILDGGNAIGYWNHLMGRYVLTGTKEDERDALEFLYTHNGTHLLIDSTEIGKYTAYSSIGADENYDRFSWISTFLMDDRQTRETNNETVYVYSGGTATDEDIIWEENGNDIFLPKKKTGIGAIILRKASEDLLQPSAIFIYHNKQHTIPLRYAYFNGELYDFENGLDAGIFVFPKLSAPSGGGLNINKIGALMYLSKRTVHSRLAELYLFGQDSDYFKIVHSQNSIFVEDMKNQGLEIEDFVYYNGLQGPIKIWEISYPSNISVNEEYLQKNYPNLNVTLIEQGEYG